MRRFEPDAKTTGPGQGVSALTYIRKPIDEVRLGMYVARLDRPWLDSPFLFQGFVLEREEDLR
ncbi:DUF3391 domain-containing protein, partial [Amycolatopsis minnesotensis]|uniref:DUF3391 domain-containing protein n=1 Tax=Amycolatopsis minnesotensis TaxID=337894 RepID=UPI0031E1E2F4